GQLPARPAATSADFWTGSWHKWGFAPRGTTALWASSEQRDRLEPLATGAPDGTPFPLAFDRTGTDDATGWYCLADAIAFWNECGGPTLAERGRALLDDGAAVVASALPAVDAPTPLETAPCMRLVPLPDGVASTAGDADKLYERLSRRGFEVQVVPYADRGYVRLSATVYNEIDDYERLAKTLPDVLI
ncbi:MAG: class V aminotransferase, partial [Actinomycetia bacterium]|nr:class V aminotransferase [Actinomycetes bacterium]